MKLNKREILFGLLFISISLIGWFTSKHSVDQELSQFLTNESTRFNKIDFSQLKTSIESEIIRRVSYDYHAGNKAEAANNLKKRYEIVNLKIKWLEFGESSKINPSGNWVWQENKSNLKLIGSQCTSTFCLNIDLILSKVLLVDAAVSLIAESSRNERFGWTSLLEDPDLKIPSGIVNYASMSAQLDGLSYGDQLFYSSSIGPKEYSLNRITVVNVSRLNEITVNRFLYFFMVIFFLTLGLFVLFQFQNNQISISYRVLFILLLLAGFVFVLLYSPSQRLIQENERQNRYNQELEILSKVSVKSLKLDYNQIRHLLPFQVGGIYSVPESEDLYIFRAIENGLVGSSYPITEYADRSHVINFILLLLLYLMSYLWFFRYNNIFWKQLSIRIEEQISDKQVWTSSDHLSDTVIYNNWDLWRKQLRAEEQVYKRISQTQISDSTLVNLLEHAAGVKVGSTLQFLDCTIISFEPFNPEDLEGQVSRNYFKELNRFIQIFRETCVKYGGVPFSDKNWSQQALFSMPRKSVSRQRAILFGLNLIRRLEDLNLPAGVYYRAVIKFGSLEFRVIKVGVRQELVVSGNALEEINAGMELLGDRRGLWIHQDLANCGPEMYFDVASEPLGSWLNLSGVKNVAEHLELLDFSTPELQKTAIELLSFKSDVRVLEKLLNVLPSIEPEARGAATEALRYYFYEDRSKTQIFEKIAELIDIEDFVTIGLFLSILEDILIPLTKNEMKILLSVKDSTLYERILSLILKSTEVENIDDLVPNVQTAAISLKVLWSLHKFRKNPMELYLDELLKYLQASNPAERVEIIILLGRILEGNSEDHDGCFYRWLNRDGNVFKSIVSGFLRSPRKILAIQTLRLVSQLKLPGMELDLVELYRSSTDSEFKSEIILSLRSLGVGAFLIQNLN